MSSEMLVSSESEPLCQLANEKPLIVGLKPEAVMVRGKRVDFFAGCDFAEGCGCARSGDGPIARAGDEKTNTHVVASKAMRFLIGPPFMVNMLSLTQQEITHNTRC
jgi:hypothetical protein